MKKLLSILLAMTFAFCSFGVISFAAGTVDYDQPFDKGTLNSDTYRIPAILTLNDGSVLAAADMRYAHGTDSPNNIETVVAISEDGYTNWQYQTINYFDDYADNYTESGSASFIDTALVQSSATGRIFAVTDAFPSGCGYLQSQKGSGYVTVNGERYLALTDGDNSDKFSSFDYYVGDFADGFAPVYKLSTGELTSYTVDEEYRLYKDGAALYMNQVGSENVQVQQNIFYNASELCVYKTSYLWLRYSDDNGKTWSAPVILNGMVKSDSEAFLGVGPGRGVVTTVNGKERIVFTAYDNEGLFENVSTIYSDDNGATWQRGEETSWRLGIGKTSEAQIITLPDGTLRMYSRNTSKYIAYADSTDGGASWSKFKADTALESIGNCMVSFINYSKQINGKNVIIGSFVSDQMERADGVVMVGLINDDNTVDWITKYHVNEGFFAYSCLTELSDGNLGYLYEDDAAHISYAVLTVSDSGEVSEINGNNSDYNGELNFFENIIKKIIEFFYMILSYFNAV